MALGGSALAQAGGKTATPTPAPAATSTASEAPGGETAPGSDGPRGQADEIKHQRDLAALIDRLDHYQCDEPLARSA